jgi:hypothetical protein
MFWYSQGNGAKVEDKPFPVPHPKGLKPAFEVEYWHDSNPEHRRFLLTNSQAVASAHDLVYTRVGWNTKLHRNRERYPVRSVCEEEA